MLKLLHSEGAWSCYVSGSGVGRELPKIAEIFTLIDGFQDTLKDDRRSLVKRGELAGMDIIAKQPRDKNRRGWSQFLSLFRDAEAKMTFKSLLKFRQMGIESVHPVCVLEKTKGKQVIDSWLLYEYREGQPCGVQDLAEVIAQLTLLHRHGFRHDDPNFGNFLRGADGQMFLIDCKGKAVGGDFGAHYDFMLLSLRNAGVTSEQVEALRGKTRWSIGRQLASAYGAYINARTALKQVLRRRKSKKDIV